MTWLFEKLLLLFFALLRDIVFQILELEDDVSLKMGLDIGAFFFNQSLLATSS